MIYGVGRVRRRRREDGEWLSGLLAWTQARMNSAAFGTGGAGRELLLWGEDRQSQPITSWYRWSALVVSSVRYAL